jgi:hypothetical protein
MIRATLPTICLVLCVIATPARPQQVPNPCLTKNATVLHGGPVSIGPEGVAFDLDLDCQRRVIDVLVSIEKPYELPDLPIPRDHDPSSVTLPDGTLSFLSASLTDPSGHVLNLSRESYLYNYNRERFVVLGRVDWEETGSPVPVRHVRRVRLMASKPIVAKRVLLRCYDPWNCEQDDLVPGPPN